MKNFFFSSILLIVFLIILIVLNLNNFDFLSRQFFISQVSPGPNEALFYLSPTSGTFNNFSVDLRINTSVAITSVKAYLNFPASVVSVSSIDTTDSIFGNWWESAFNNATGKIQLQASVAAPGYQGATGLIAKINFQGVSSGAAGITYDSASLALKSDDTNVLNLTNSETASFTIDTTAPVRSSGSPSGTLPSGTTNTTISLTTNESATCKYSATANTAYSSMTSTFSTTGGTSHSTLVTGLSNGTTYNYYVRCQDAAGNSNTNDFTITFSVASSPCINCGLITPVVTPSSPNAGQVFTITCSANAVYNCIDAYADAVLCSFVPPWSGNNANFSCSGLSAGTHTAKCTAKTGTSDNCCADEKTVSFTVQALDTTPPVRSSGQPTGTLPSGTTNTTISLTTNESATCKYGTTANTSYASLPNTFSTTGGTSHSQSITGLTNGTTYNYYVRCQDTAGNPNTNDFTITFSVALPGFSISNVTPNYLFRDKNNSLTIAGSSFNLSTNFSLKFASGTTDINLATVQPANSTTFNISLTSGQLSSVPLGFYDLKLERSTDMQSQTYSSKVLLTLLGDISSPTPGTRDGKVNIYDVSRLMSKWGSTNAADLADCDINAGPGNVSQGKIDLYDANKMMVNWLP